VTSTRDGLNVPSSQAADIISGLPAERQLSVVRRVATMGQTSPEIIQEVEKGLERRMAAVMSQSSSRTPGASPAWPRCST